MTILNEALNLFLKRTIYRQINADEVIERQRFVVFRIFTYTALLVCISVASKMLLTLGKINWLPFAVLTLGFVVLVNFIRIHRKEQLKSAYFIMFLACLVLLHCVAYSCGGIRTGGTFFLTAVIIYSFMLLGRNGGWLITSLATVHILVIFYLSTYTDVTSFSLFEDRLDLINEDFLTNILLTFVLIAALSNYLQSGRNVVIRRIVEAKLELEKKNAELVKRNSDLEKKNIELDKFASVASHDLRAPLRAIGSLSDMILEDEESLSYDAKSKIQIIRKRAHRMDHLLSALLEYSRADRQTKPAALVDVNSLLVGLFAKHAAKKDVEFLVSDAMPVMITPPASLERVFDELISNALKFNDKDRAFIQVSSKQVNDHFQFSISDNGPGIDEAYREKIFVIFQTLEARDTFESTGAGLAIAKKIVQENGGDIWASSEKQEGVTFHFTWKPKVDSEEEAIITPFPVHVSNIA